jgi:hypothetical protein
LAATRVITAKNPVHAALYLVLAFFSGRRHLAAAESAEFLAIVLVLVYVGAVMVLFLFVVMMLDVDIDSLRQGFWKLLPVGGRHGVLIVLEMAYVLMGGFRDMLQAGPVAGALRCPMIGEHPRTRQADLHRVFVRLRDRRGDPAGGDRSPPSRSPCASARTASSSIRPTRSRCVHATACASW